MSADVQKYAILVEGERMVHFDCAPNDLVAFCAQVARETGKPCPALSAEKRIMTAQAVEHMTT